MRTRAILGWVLGTAAAVAIAACSVVAGLGDYREGTADAGATVEAGGVEAGGDASDGGAAAACDGSTGGLPVSIRANVTPLQVAVRAATGDVFWTEVASPNDKAGSVVHAPPCALGPNEDDVLQTGVRFATDNGSAVAPIAVDEAFVYWATTGDAGGGMIMRQSVGADAGPEVFVDQSTQVGASGPSIIEAIAIVGSRVCWMEQVPGTAVHVWSLDGDAAAGSPTPVGDTNGQSPFYILAATKAGLFVYHIGEVDFSGHPETASSLGSIANGQAALSLAAFGTVAYWGNQLADGGAEVRSVDEALANGGNSTSLVPGPYPPIPGVAANATRLYFTSGPPGGTGQVLSYELDGGAITTGAGQQLAPAAIVANGGDLIWIDRGGGGVGNGAVMRLGL